MEWTAPPHRYEFEDGSFVEIGIARVPPSESFPSGHKYRFQYVDQAGVPRLRYDNAHGQHDRHVGPDAAGEPIDFPGDVRLHLGRFFAEVDRLRSGCLGRDAVRREIDGGPVPRHLSELNTPD